MATTIQVSETTMQLLKKVKERTNSATYDEAIKKLIAGQKEVSLAGFLARKPHYTRAEILKDLRDKVDKY